MISFKSKPMRPKVSAIYAGNANVSDLATRLPVAIRFVGAALQISCSRTVTLELFAQPLKPFPTFLRTAPLSLEGDVVMHAVGGHSYDPAHNIINHFQRNDSDEYGVSERFQN